MRAIILMIFVLMAGCATPVPFKYGPEVEPPHACKQYTARGGKCSLREGLKQVHKRFKYTDDKDNYPELANFINRYQVDYWTLLPESGKGDCEDFALTLRWWLNQRGITGTNLVTVIMPRGGDHIALELDGWIMDNTNIFPRLRRDLEKLGWVFTSGGDERGRWRSII